MLLQPANFLILDEPTNHLDLHSQEVLQRALGDYTGAFAIVSHNRSFLDPIVTKVLEFIPGEPPKVYYGNVTDYLEKKRADMDAAAVKAAPPKVALSGKPGKPSPNTVEVDSNANRKEQRRLEAKAREDRAARLKPLKTEFATLEAEIAKLEAEKEQLNANLADPDFFSKGDQSAAAMKRFSEIETILEVRYSKWEDLSGKIEGLEA
jgi:ATP-binding cassette subfamily F protein 3